MFLFGLDMSAATRCRRAGSYRLCRNFSWFIITGVSMVLKFSRDPHRPASRVVQPREEWSESLYRISLHRRRVRSQIADCEASDSEKEHTWSSSWETFGGIHAPALAVFGTIR